MKLINKHPIILGTTFFLFLFSLSLAKAVTYISDCSVLDQEGETYYLTQDIIDSEANPCFPITSPNIVLDCQGHLVDAKWYSDNTGVISVNIYNLTIKNCTFTDWWIGIYLSNITNSIITNIVSNNNLFGIGLFESYNNTISNNTASYNHYNGFDVAYSHNNTLINNIAEYNNQFGFKLDNSENNSLVENKIENSEYGIWCYKSKNNVFRNNIIKFSILGIFLSYYSDYNILINNTMFSNFYGIELYYYSLDNVLIGNKVDSDSKDNAITSSSSSLISYDNEFYNSSQYDVYITSSNATFINTTYDTEYVGDEPINIYRKWYLGAKVNVPSDIEVRDKYNSLVYSNTTKDFKIVLTEYYQNTSGKYYFYPYTIRAKKAGYKEYSLSFDLDGNKNVSIILSFLQPKLSELGLGGMIGVLIIVVTFCLVPFFILKNYLFEAEISFEGMIKIFLAIAVTIAFIIVFTQIMGWL